MPVRTKENNQRLPRLYWKIKRGEGVFATRVQDEQGGEVEQTANEIEGVLSSVFVINDEGNKKKGIDPNQKVALTIFDDEAIHQLSANSTTNFASSLASRVVNLSRGDRIKLSIRKGKKDTVAFAEVQVLVDGEWTPCKWDQLDADKGKKIQQTLDIFEQHTAKSLPQPVEDSTTV